MIMTAQSGMRDGTFQVAFCVATEATGTSVIKRRALSTILSNEHSTK